MLDRMLANEQKKTEMSPSPVAKSGSKLDNFFKKKDTSASNSK